MVHSHLGPAHYLLSWPVPLYRVWSHWDCHISMLGSLLASNIGANGVPRSPVLDTSSSGYKALSWGQLGELSMPLPVGFLGWGLVAARCCWHSHLGWTYPSRVFLQMTWLPTWQSRSSRRHWQTWTCGRRWPLEPSISRGSSLPGRRRLVSPLSGF